MSLCTRLLHLRSYILNLSLILLPMVGLAALVLAPVGLTVCLTHRTELLS